MKGIELYSVIIFAFCCYVGDAKQIVIAHRGASGYLPEHTKEAKVASFMMGADYLEQDVVLTSDFVPIVSHDIYLDEVTNVAEIYPDRSRSDSRFYVIDFTFDEIKKLKVSERFRYTNRSAAYFPLRFPLWKSDFSISSLQEEIELIQGIEQSFSQIYNLDKKGILSHGLVRKAGIYPEIKDPYFHRKEGKDNFSEIILSVLSQYGYRTKNDRAFVQCFDPIELRRIHNEIKTDLPLIQLMPVDVHDNQTDIDWNSVEGIREIAKFADGIGPAFQLLVDTAVLQSTGVVKSTELYNEARRLGLLIHPYTFRIDQLPPGIADYDTLMRIFYDDLNVDGVFTDFPDLTRQYLNNKNSAVKTTIKNNLFFIFSLLALFYIL